MIERSFIWASFAPLFNPIVYTQDPLCRQDIIFAPIFGCPFSRVMWRLVEERGASLHYGLGSIPK